MTTVVGIDWSLSSSGVVRATDTGQMSTHRVQSKPTADTLHARSLRIRKMAMNVIGLTVGADLVVIEGPAYASDTGKAHDRSGGWWLIVARVTALGIPIAEVPPPTLKVWLTGKGRRSKDEVLADTIHRYGHLTDIRSNDVADALGLATIGLAHLGHPLVDLPLTHTRALAGVKWPN